MSEALEGTVQGVNKNDRGVGFTLKGREGWYNFSKFLPREHQDGLTLPEPPPEVREGQQVRFLYDVNKMGKSYIQVNPDGSHEFSVLDTTPPSQNGGSSYAQEKNDAIQWAVCLKLAGDICIANQRSTITSSTIKVLPICSSDVLTLADALFQGGPSSNGDPIKAALSEFVEKITPQPQAIAADGDPGPQEPMSDAP